MPSINDGPRTLLFQPLPLNGNLPFADLSSVSASSEMVAASPQAPTGDCVAWGLPFNVGVPVVLADQPVTTNWAPLRARWLVFMHTSDLRLPKPDAHGFIRPMRGEGALGEHAADYVVCYADGSEERAPILRRHQIGALQHRWGENCFAAVSHSKPRSIRAHHEQANPNWGASQTRATIVDWAPWMNWLYAWQNPHPDRAIVGLRCEPVCGVVVLSAVSAGNAGAHPLRWEPRRKAVLTLPAGAPFHADLDERGLLLQVQLDMGQVIRAERRLRYSDDDWEISYNNQVPENVPNQILLEYTAHNDASFHLSDGRVVTVAEVSQAPAEASLRPVASATRAVTLRVLDKATSRPVAAKLHVHGEAGEYLAPIDRNRIPNDAWYEDWSVDFVHRGAHRCTYIAGETRLRLPIGRVYIEVSKGFESVPVRKIVAVTPETSEIQITLDKVLPWRERGWVTADTHVHFLSPMTALLEGSAEGVNVVNLLASQWGELMTNVGDWDGRTTWGSREAGGDGEWLVRVGTENRQHVMGHISLLGYNGDIIAPMTTGGPDESALGDPVEILLTEWARQCRQQGGLVVLPHFPNPRAEHAAAIVEGQIDGIEMTAWGDHYSGIDPYSLSDWYRYLNCGYQVAAVAGTDKMSANTAVGTVRTYARIAPNEPFTYDAWMAAVRRGETFATYGPLLEFSVDGQPMGGRIALTASGGTLEVEWRAASVTVPMTRVELVVNGEIRESLSVDPREASGHWSVKVNKSSWLALLVRGQYPDKPEMIAAHSSVVMATLEGSQFWAAADAVTILEQIEGAIAYLDTVGTRAETVAYKRMRLVLESAHRRVHNQLHSMGRYHEHTPTEDHREHH